MMRKQGVRIVFVGVLGAISPVNLEHLQLACSSRGLGNKLVARA